MYGKRKETTAIVAAYKGVILEENTNSSLNRKLFRVSIKNIPDVTMDVKADDVERASVSV